MYHSLADRLDASHSLRRFAERFSYSSLAAPEPLLGMTYGQLVDAMAELNGDKIFISDRATGRSITFGRFKEMVDETARALIALDVQKGDRVAMLGMNSADWVVIQFAAPSIGAWFVNLNAAFPEEQLGRMIEHSDPKVIVSQSHYARNDYFGMLRNLHSTSEDRILVATDGSVAPPGFLDWRSFIGRGRNVSSEELQARKDSVGIEDVNMVCYTGGTSGALKGAIRTHFTCVNCPFKVATMVGLDSSSVVCTNFLFFHTAGMNSGSTMAMVAGARLVIPAPGFDVAATLAALYEEGCTFYSGVPTTIKALLDHPDFDANRLKLKNLFTGATACPPELMERVRREIQVPFHIGYGGTEIGPLCITMPADPEDKQINTVGRISPHSEAKIVDRETGKIVRRGEPGEVCSRGVFTMRGYYRAPELTASVLDDYGWYHSGDLGIMDEDGYIRILGRIDDMIIRGGENVQPGDVESVIRRWPGIAAVHVVGVPDPAYGHEIAAWVVVDGGFEEEALRAHCRTHLAYYQIPRWFFRTDALPQTGVGKTDRSKLRQLADERVRQGARVFNRT